MALARYALAADQGLKSVNLDMLLETGPVFPKPEAFA
jgi:cytochrome b pre-mRNA-processing protein 3